MKYTALYKKGFLELKESLISHEQWLYMAILDIKLRYRRSILGPWWVTLSTGIMVSVLGFLWSHLFGSDIQNYLPFFAVGYIIWSWMSTQLLDAAGGFFQFANIIKQVKVPFPILTLRLNMRQCIVLFHNMIIIFLVGLLIGHGFNWLIFLVIPHLILIQINLSLLTVLITIFCTRYQDMTQVVNVGTQIIFFLTPILWEVASLKDRMYIADLNPIYHWIEMIRAPLLGHIPTLYNYLWTGASTIILFFFTAYCLGRFRSRIAYWL